MFNKNLFIQLENSLKNFNPISMTLESTNELSTQSYKEKNPFEIPDNTSLISMYDISEFDNKNKFTFGLGGCTFVLGISNKNESIGFHHPCSSYVQNNVEKELTEKVKNNENKFLNYIDQLEKIIIYTENGKDTSVSNHLKTHLMNKNINIELKKYPNTDGCILYLNNKKELSNNYKTKKSLDYKKEKNILQYQYNEYLNDKMKIIILNTTEYIKISKDEVYYKEVWKINYVFQESFIEKIKYQLEIQNDFVKEILYLKYALYFEPIIFNDIIKNINDNINNVSKEEKKKFLSLINITNLFIKTEHKREFDLINKKELLKNKTINIKNKYSFKNEKLSKSNINKTKNF